MSAFRHSSPRGKNVKGASLRRELVRVRARLAGQAGAQAGRPTRYCRAARASAQDFLELFESQLVSRTDLMARVLSVQQRSSNRSVPPGHEGNAYGGAPDAPHRSGVPALPQRRLHGRALPQAAGHGSDHGFGAELRSVQRGPDLRRPPQGLGQQAAVGAAADLDHCLAPAQGVGHRGGDRAGAAHRPRAADPGRFDPPSAASATPPTHATAQYRLHCRRLDRLPAFAGAVCTCETNGIGISVKTPSWVASNFRAQGPATSSRRPRPVYRYGQVQAA